MGDIRVERLTLVDVERARTLLTLMPVCSRRTPHRWSDSYIAGLLPRSDFWALAASVDGQTEGGHHRPGRRARLP